MSQTSTFLYTDKIKLRGLRADDGLACELSQGEENKIEVHYELIGDELHIRRVCAAENIELSSDEGMCSMTIFYGADLKRYFRPHDIRAFEDEIAQQEPEEIAA